MKKNDVCQAAVIDIGSNLMRMTVAQQSGQTITELDTLEYPVELGHDTFTRGAVSSKTAQELVRGLQGFQVASAQLGVAPGNLRMIATTALREAENGAYVADRLALCAGLPVEVLEDGQEKAYIFAETLRRLQSVSAPGEALLLAYIGTGSVGLAVARDGVIRYVRNIRAGSLKLSQMLSEMESRPGRMYEVLEEYLSTLFWGLPEQIAHYAPHTLVVCGRDMAELAELAAPGARDSGRVEAQRLRGLYDRVKKLNPSEVQALLGISAERSEMLLPSLSIYLRLAGMTHARIVSFQGVTTADALLYEMLQPKAAKEWQRVFDEGIVATAKEAAKWLESDMNHVDYVEAQAVMLFNTLRKLHGFSRRERLLLQTAVAMHDCGRSLNTTLHAQTSSHLLQDAALMGLSQAEVRTAALLVRYHDGQRPTVADYDYALLTPGERVAVSKLTAILQLAEALDTGHQQKLCRVEAAREEEGIVLTAQARSNAALEKWAFARRADFFREVFGLSCKLKVRRGE
ncbi:MAG: hypothetical protein PHD32_01730 [Eubacteriales bacterium]|nr:hypothetical protein [Eubacteriales bacterium]